MKQITVYDIAKEANVSVATVSRVLNGTAPVKGATRDKIRSIMDKYQFLPNALARSLTKKETGTIGIILPDITNPFFPEVFWGAENEAREKGYTFFMCNTGGEHSRESDYLSILKEKRVDGILFLGGRINLNRCRPELVQEVVELAERVPVVLVNGNLPNGRLARVFADESAGAVQATQHLIDLGHREIGFVGGYDYMSTTTQKVKAFRDVLVRNGLVYRPEWELHGDFSIQSGRELMKRLLGLPARPTAVFCVNDFTAIGAIKAAVELGYAVPGDLSVVGFDDSLLSTAVIPELTTVSQHTNELGRLAVRTLHRMIAGETARKRTVLQPELVIRQSTGPGPYRKGNL